MFSTAMAGCELPWLVPLTAGDRVPSSVLFEWFADALIVSPACGRRPFYFPVERCGASLLHQLALGDEHFGGHARDKTLVGVRDEKLDLNGFNVAFAAAIDVALGSEIGFRRLGNDLSLNCRAAGHDQAETIA